MTATPALEVELSSRAKEASWRQFNCGRDKGAAVEALIFFKIVILFTIFTNFFLTHTLRFGIAAR
jgi:hypothetical protein